MGAGCCSTKAKKEGFGEVRIISKQELAKKMDLCKKTGQLLLTDIKLPIFNGEEFKCEKMKNVSVTNCQIKSITSGEQFFRESMKKINFNKNEFT